MYCNSNSTKRNNFSISYKINKDYTIRYKISNNVYVLTY